MMEIEKLLKMIPGVDDYRILTQTTRSYETFFVHRKLETVRATDTQDTTVTVYVKHDGKLGDSAFSLFPSMTESDAARKIEAAVSRARLVFNEPYELPAGGEEEAELPSNMAGEKLPELAQRVADAVFAADCYAGGAINATEIFLYETVTEVRNSRGVRKTQVKHHAMIEAIPTWNEGVESVELYEDHQFADFDPADVTAEIDRRMREVRDRQAAVKPQTPITCDAVLLPLEIMSLLREIIPQMSAQAVYAHSNIYNPGDDLQKNAAGDRLTVTMAGAVKGSAQSAAFDEDGISLGECVIIKDGVVAARFGDNRYAQYLGETPTGNLRCVRLAPGTMDKDAPTTGAQLEIMSMSGLQVDLYNDYIGGEIRLAYLVEDGKRTPVTGISMSAKLSEVLPTLRLSKTTTVFGRYEGPDRLLLRGVSVL